MKTLLSLLFVSVAAVHGQTVTWQNVTTHYTLPAGITVFHGTRTTPQLSAWYVDADLTIPTLAIRPYITGAPMTVPAFTSAVGAYVSVNGGFFGGSSSYSAVVYPNEVKAVNVQSVSRNATAYPVIRSFFGMKTDRSFAVDWIYQFGNALTDISVFTAPLPYISNDPTPRPAPLAAGGTQYRNLLTGIGGAPVLVKNSAVHVTYNQEIMWGSGVGETNGDPRTAVGYTAGRHVIMMTVDGRQTGSSGVGLPELAQMMLDLGCVEALNLDGGGSTQMAVSGQYINSPSEQRAVPTILSIVHTDSLNLPEEPLFQKVIDTGDSNASSTGGGWFESANPGHWGTTRSILHPLGSGSAQVEFRAHLPARAIYSVYGWWVASSNRCTNTPFIIAHAQGTDTVRVDQVQNGSAWKLIGIWEFSGTAADRVVISDAGTSGSYVVADAIKIESYDPKVLTSVSDPQHGSLEAAPMLLQNYPNPFNPVTIIRFHNAAGIKQRVTLTVHDILGRTVAVLVDGTKAPGTHEIRWNPGQLSGGVYFCRLQAGDQKQVMKMVFLK